MVYNNYHKKNNNLYKSLKTRFGYDTFHIYNILSENAPRSDIDRLRGELQGLKWDGLIKARKKKAVIKIRGKTIEVTQYSL